MSETPEKLPYVLLLVQLIFTEKKFNLSTKSAKLMKISVHLDYENIHIFCPQLVDI